MAITLPNNVRGPALDLTLPASAEATDLTVRNNTTGKTLTINLPTAWAGDDLVLDWFRRTIQDQTGKDRSDLLDAADSDLWSSPAGFLPGASNDLEIEAVCAALTGQDPFNQTAGTLAAKNLPLGGTWAEAGGAGVFSVVAGESHCLQRTQTNDGAAIGRLALAGAAEEEGTVVAVDAKVSTLGLGPPYQGVFCRYKDVSNYVYAIILFEESTSVFVYKVVAGVATKLSGTAVGSYAANTNHRIALQVERSGAWSVSFDDSTVATGTDEVLAAGKTLGKGRRGIYDQWSGSTGKTRTYDNFTVRSLAPAAYAAKAALRWDRGYF